MTLPIFPELNVGFSVIKRSLTGAGVTQAASGRETRVSYWTFPMWEWDLTYEYLPDDSGGWQSGKTISDIKTLMGLYGQVGILHPFLYEDPDDNFVYHMGIGTGDGINQTFIINRTYGAGGFSTWEPIGLVNEGHPFNVFLDGVLQTSGVALDATITYLQKLNFDTPPGPGVIVSVDMYYYYVVRFKDGSLEFEKFSHRLWSVKKVTLMSLKDQINA